MFNESGYCRIFIETGWLLLLAGMLLFTSWQCAGLRPRPYNPANVPRVRLVLFEGAPLVCKLRSSGEAEGDAGAVVPLKSGSEVFFEPGRRPGTIRVRHGNRRVVLKPPVVFRLRREKKGIELKGHRYVGGFELHRRGNKLVLYNLLDLETYVKGVVAAEMGRVDKDAFEALKAQAVAARTYAYMRMREKRSGLPALYASERDQVYLGLGRRYGRADRAVEETVGEVLTYRGKPFLPYYHSTCGGRTENVERVFGGGARPYLRGIADTFGGEDFCVKSPHYRWVESYSFRELKNMLLRYARETDRFQVPEGDLQNAVVLERSPSGRVRKLALLFENVEKPLILNGQSIRWAIRRFDGSPLRSTLFKLLPYGPKDRPTGVLIMGAGNGHGVGMCQWGAMGMAKKGYRYDQILQHYFRGSQIKKIY